VQQSQAALDHEQQLREPEDVQPRCGELDRERQTVDEATDFRDHLGGARRQLESWARRARAIDEELHRRGSKAVGRLRDRQPERLDRESHLAREMEHLAARREHPDVGALGENGRCDSRRLPDDGFARIEEQDGVAVAEARDRARERVGAAGVDDGGDETRNVVGTSRSREVDAPRIPLGLERARGLDREAALPDARRPRQRHEAVLAQQLDDVGDVLLAADERRRRSRQVATAPRRHGDRRDRRIVREDRLLEPPEVGAGLERQLVREHAPRLVERLEGVGLAAAAVQREHQLPPEPLAERVLLERRANRGDDLAMLSDCERGLELLFESVDAKRLEPPRLRAEPWSFREPVQRRAAPERQRDRDRLGRGSGIAGA
jgi:hypothetical protein